MKNIVLIALIATTMLACNNSKKDTDKQDNTSEITQEQSNEINHNNDDEKVEDPILVGKQDINAIKARPYASWFMEHYKYTPDQKTLRALKDAIKGKNITVFMGTWCSDSQQQVPALIYTLEAINYDTSTINLITVSREKDTPDGLEKGFDIQYVPTIIVFDGTKELGRIVEYPIESLEQDLLKIATGQEYKHAYSETAQEE